MMTFGGTCHEYRLMAFGHGVFLLTGQQMPWDHNAGLLAHAEAGGDLTQLDGTAYQPTIHDGRVLAAISRTHWEPLRNKFAFLVLTQHETGRTPETTRPGTCRRRVLMYALSPYRALAIRE